MSPLLITMTMSKVMMYSSMMHKEVFICGKTKDASANVVAFVAKLSATGVKEWEKTLELGMDNLLQSFKTGC